MKLSEKLLPVTVIRALAGPITRAFFFTIVNVLALTVQPWASRRSMPPDARGR